MFKDILYPTLCSLQNQTPDGRIMYLTGTLVVNIYEYIRSSEEQE